MSEKIIVPALGESVTEATVSKWLKSVGEEVNSDEPLVELETDKVNVEVPSPISGTLGSIVVSEGENPMEELKNYTKKRRKSESASKAKKSKSIFNLPKFSRD